MRNASFCDGPMHTLVHLQIVQRCSARHICSGLCDCRLRQSSVECCVLDHTPHTRTRVETDTHDTQSTEHSVHTACTQSQTRLGLLPAPLPFAVSRLPLRQREAPPLRLTAPPGQFATTAGLCRTSALCRIDGRRCLPVLMYDCM